MQTASRFALLSAMHQYPLAMQSLAQAGCQQSLQSHLPPMENPKLECQLLEAIAGFSWSFQTPSWIVLDVHATLFGMPQVSLIVVFAHLESSCFHSFFLCLN